MSQTLAPGQIGWVWLWAWNKENTRGVMLYQMLDQGGKLSAFHRATVMKQTKEGISVDRTRDVSLVRGMHGGCLELRKIRFLVDHKVKIFVKPKLKDQLLKGAVRYWEGAAQINFGKETGRDGKGYLEVTGMNKRKKSLANMELCQSKEKSP